ncbi:MAG: hypothetical protein MUP62_02195 [Dehalococcoidia bacterium]|nr:hypothetical protein [Dehalococcoidia bacterium]
MADLLSGGSYVGHPMEDNRGVTAAITAAVIAYLEEEERARLAVAPQPKPLAPISQWRVVGRREVMRPRALWQ